MNILIDSSVWIEFFAEGPKAKALEKYLKPPHKTILPSIVSYEVYKKIKDTKGERIAILILAQLERLSSTSIPIDQGLAIQAADLSLQYKLPMADALIYSTALLKNATVLTMDAHFKGLPQVHFIGA